MSSFFKKIIFFSFVCLSILIIQTVLADECSDSCGQPASHPDVYYEECCSDESVCKGTTYQSGAWGFCTAYEDLMVSWYHMPEGRCYDLPASFCCDDGKLHTMYLNTLYWLTDANCGEDYCQCHETTGGDCSGNTDGFEYIPSTCRGDAEACSCPAWCCSGVCESGVCVCAPSCPDPSTYYPEDEIEDGCGGFCPEGTKEHNIHCAVSITFCPSTVNTGANFQVDYEFLGTGGDFPYEVRTFLRGTTELGCIYDEDYQEEVTHSGSVTFTCPSTPGLYDFTVKCRGMGTIDENNCNVDDFSDTCAVECIDSGVASTGHIRIQGPSGIIKLNIISATDAIAAGRGTIKVAMFTGDTGSAADLVPVTDPDASPVRVYTGVGGGNGIWAWRMIE